MCGPLYRCNIDTFFVHIPQGRQLTQLADLGFEQFNRKVDIFFGRETAEGKTNRTMRELITAAQCSRLADVQADPEDTAMSLMAIMSDSPST